MTDCRNELEIQVLGLQRSGNHAILAWLFQQFDEPVYFFNNVRHFGNPMREFQPVDLPNTVPMRRGNSPGRTRRLHEVEQQQKKTLVYSYENLPLDRLRVRSLVPDRENVIGRSRRLCRVLIVRDFYNWLASRIRYHEITRSEVPPFRKVERFVSGWLAYASEYLRITDYIADMEVTAVSYNRWVTDERYRHELLLELDVPVKNNSISYVPRAGGGSSFDATEFCGRSAGMRIGDRWLYLKDEKFRDIVLRVQRRQPQIEKYNDRILGYSFRFA